MLPFLAATLLPVLGQSVYREPDFKTDLFDSKALSATDGQRIEWGRALTAIARNFPKDATVSARAKAMGLFLTMQLLPMDRDAVIGNYHLRRALEPTPTPYYLEKSMVLALLESAVAKPGETDADRVCQTLMQDVLDELLDRERSDGLAWQRSVSSPARPLKRHSTRISLMDFNGNTRSWAANGLIDESKPFSVKMRGRPFRVSQKFRSDLEEHYPYLSQHLQVMLMTNVVAESMGTPTEFLISLFIRQMADGWTWDPDMVLCPQSGKDNPVAFMHAMNRYFQRQLKLPRVLMVPPLPAETFRDWMAFDQMHRVLATEWIAVSTAEEAAQWHTPTPDQQKARGLFSNCQGFMRRPTFNRRALANHQGIRSHLNEIKALELSHLSASVLSFYANLQSNPKASLQASLEWVNALSAKVMISGSNRYSKRFKNEICDRALEQIRRISPNLNSKVKPLVSA
ncbi:MAG: hypothetical protein ACKVHP_16815, partial [Verrucomicrobiales bacterium]